MTAKPQGIALIPAGSLFTSCIEQVEPLGIQDMRFAKAEYIRALKDLRAADAEYVRAQAAFELARARYKDAQTANLNADTEYQKLLNEYQQLLNEARQDTNDFISQETANKIDSIKKRMELRELQHQKDMVDAEKDLAQAREQLRVALRDIALYSQSLTPAEQSALAAAVYMYETAFEETADQTIVVLQAQRTLDSLKLVREVGPDTAYDKSSKAYIGQVDKWKKDIETKQVEQALVAALLLAVPDSLVYDDVDGWKEQIDELVKDSTELAYNQYQVKTEMANYYTANIHDGVKVFNDMITEFKNEWWEGGIEPTAPSKPGTEPKPTDKKYKPENYLSDSLAFTEFRKSDEISNASFAKFSYLLESYMTTVSPISKATPKNKFMKASTPKGDTLSFGPVKQDMKTFILGAKGNGEKSQKYNDTTIANYGLWGAYDILERELVTKASTPGRTVEDILEDLNEADSVWGAHRQILIDGLAAYEPFTDTVALFELAMAKEIADRADMKAAIEALATALNPIVTKDPTLTKADGGAYIDYHDSTQVLRALIDFAAARNEYFDYEYDAENDAHDLNYFRFATGKNSVTGKAIVDSVLFTDLTFEALSNHVYDFDAEGAGDAEYTAGGVGKQYGLANIMNQLLGADFATKLQTKPVPAFVYDPMEFFGGAYRINGGVAEKYDDATSTWVAYTPELSTDYEAALKRVAQEYVDVYNSFWGEAAAVGTELDTYIATVKTELQKTSPDYEKMEKDLNDAIDAIEGLFAPANDPECYTAATFKPYSNKDKSPIVVFDGADIVYTNAMGAILASVDPNADPADPTGASTFDNSGVVDGAAIFEGTADYTDFYALSYYEYEYWKATNKVAEKDLEYIKAWIEGVEATFEADEEAAPGKATKQYNDDHKAWETTKKNYDTKKAAYDEYVAAKAEFAGITVDEKGDTTVNAIVGPLTDPCTGLIPGEEFATIASVEIPELVEPKNVYGFYPGLWNEDLGGAQLEAAQMLFPEYPVELQEWDVTIQETEDQLLHYATLIQAAKKAYFAAAKIAGENVDDATNWDELIENYKAANKNYRERLLGIIEDLQEEIETIEEAIAKFNQGLPQLDIAIAMAEKELKVETARLQGYEEALAYAKANLDHLLEYIKSLDVNFVVPAVDLDD